MILTCPACGTRYTVADGAVGPAGRQVRCASCKHSWFQEPEPAVEAEEAIAPPAPAIDPDAAAPETKPAPVVPSPPPVAAPEDTKPAETAVVAAKTNDQKVVRPRGRLGLWLLLALIALAAAAAAAWYSGKLTLPGVPQAQAAARPLKLDYAQPERSVLESGNELLRVHGTIENPSDKPQRVPQIRAELRNGSGQVVHRFDISPPVAELGPGKSATFDTAETNVPREAERLRLTFAPVA